MEELKIYITNPDATEEKLKSIGSTFVKELTITDTYYNQPEMVLKITEDQISPTLTQLQPIDGGFKFIKEEKLTDLAAKKKELEAQFGVKSVLNKRKRIWKFQNYNINLNLFKDIGNFLIVEGEKVTQDFFTKTLAIENPKYLTKSFAQLKSELTPKNYILLSDLGGVLLHSKDKSYKGKLNPIYDEESKKEGFNFFNYFELNQELLEYYYSLKQKGLTFYMVTEGSIQNDPAIKPDLEKIFKQIYSLNQMGFSKKDSELYEKLAQEMNKEISEIIYIDDSEENINASAQSGMKAFQYKDNQRLIQTIESLFN